MSFIDKSGFKKRKPYEKKVIDLLEASYGKEADGVIEFTQKTRFSPSALFYNKGKGICARYWYIAFNGADFQIKMDPEVLDILDSGTRNHERIQAAFEDSEFDVELEVSVEHSEPPIKGYIDLLVHGILDNPLPIEIKTIRTESYDYRLMRGAQEYHKLQLLLYMYLNNWNAGLLLYENRNDLRKLIVPVEMDDESKATMEKLFDWMNTVWRAYKEKQLPVNVFRSNSVVCKTCPVQKTCYSMPEGEVRIEKLHLYD